MIAIIDYDAGNLKSVEKAFLALGEECVVTRDHDSIRRADRVVLPGVGSFGTAMQQLKKYELDQVIREVVQEDKPFLGICLGLQLLFEGSEESDGVEGLHLLDGEIVKIPEAPGLKIPHIGWNSLDFPHEGRLFAGLKEQPYLFCAFLLPESERSVDCEGDHRVRRDDSCFRGEGQPVCVPVSPGEEQHSGTSDIEEFCGNIAEACDVYKESDSLSG